MSIHRLLQSCPAWQISLALHGALVLAMHLTIIPRLADAYVHSYEVELRDDDFEWPELSGVQPHGDDAPAFDPATHDENLNPAPPPQPETTAGDEDGDPAADEPAAPPGTVDGVADHFHRFRRLRLKMCPRCKGSNSQWSSCLHPGCETQRPAPLRCPCSR